MYKSGVAPLEMSVKSLREKVDSMDKTLFNIDKAQLKIRLAMRSETEGNGNKNHSAAFRDSNGKMVLSGEQPCLRAHQRIATMGNIA